MTRGLAQSKRPVSRDCRFELFQGVCVAWRKQLAVKRREEERGGEREIREGGGGIIGRRRQVRNQPGDQSEFLSVENFVFFLIYFFLFINI